jgi:hypothetical protein
VIRRESRANRSTAAAKTDHPPGRGAAAPSTTPGTTEPGATGRPARMLAVATAGFAVTFWAWALLSPLGSGIWNIRPPMIMRTFVENVDLSGKTIFPFVTYAVSGLGSTIDDYTRLCPRSTIGEGLAVRGEQARDARADVRAWLRRTGLLSQ